jgi:hypothetical protein
VTAKSDVTKVVIFGKALSHPLRLEFLELVDAEPCSPRGASQKLDVALGVMSYHCTTLVSLGFITLVSTQPRRGTIEHFYLSTDRGRYVVQIARWIVQPPSSSQGEEQAIEDEEQKRQP